MFQRFIKFKIMFILSFFTMPTLALEDCDQVYKDAKISCSATQVHARDKRKIEKSTDAAAGAMAIGLQQMVSNTYAACGRLLSSCRTVCGRDKVKFNECKEDGALGVEYKKIKDLYVSGGQNVVIPESKDENLKTTKGPQLTGGLGLPTDLSRPSMNNTNTSHEYVMEDMKSKGGVGANVGVSIPIGVSK